MGVYDFVNYVSFSIPVILFFLIVTALYRSSASIYKTVIVGYLCTCFFLTC